MALTPSDDPFRFHLAYRATSFEFLPTSPRRIRVGRLHTHALELLTSGTIATASLALVPSSQTDRPDPVKAYDITDKSISSFTTAFAAYSSTYSLILPYSTLHIYILRLLCIFPPHLASA